MVILIRRIALPRAPCRLHTIRCWVLSSMEPLALLFSLIRRIGRIRPLISLRWMNLPMAALFFMIVSPRPVIRIARLIFSRRVLALAWIDLPMRGRRLIVRIRMTRL